MNTSNDLATLNIANDVSNIFSNVTETCCECGSKFSLFVENNMQCVTVKKNGTVGFLCHNCAKDTAEYQEAVANNDEWLQAAENSDYALWRKQLNIKGHAAPIRFIFTQS